MPVAARGGCGTRRPSTNPNNETTESTFMEKINAVITGVGGYVPEYVLNNDELSRMVDTNDEWIMTRIGIKERRILNEEGLGTSYMARKAVKQLLQKTGTDPQEVDCLIVATTTPDYHFPSTSSIVI